MKRTFSIKGPALLVMTAIIGAEMFSAPGSAHLPVPSPAPIAIQHSVIDARTNPPSFENAANVIVARPMFSTGRSHTGANEREIAGQPSDLPRLAGTMTGHSFGVALFQTKDVPKPISVAIGGSVAGWKVERIAANSVTLARDGHIYIAHPKTVPAPEEQQQAANEMPPTMTENGLSLVPLQGS